MKGGANGTFGENKADGFAQEFFRGNSLTSGSAPKGKSKEWSGHVFGLDAGALGLMQLVMDVGISRGEVLTQADIPENGDPQVVEVMRQTTGMHSQRLQLAASNDFIQRTLAGGEIFLDHGGPRNPAA